MTQPSRQDSTTAVADDDARAAAVVAADDGALRNQAIVMTTLVVDSDSDRNDSFDIKMSDPLTPNRPKFRHPLSNNANLKTSDKNDDVKFVNDTQVKRFIDAGQDPFERATNSAKIGRTVRQILTANNISVTDQQIEKFVNTYKNAWDKSFKKTSEGIMF